MSTPNRMDIYNFSSYQPIGKYDILRLLKNNFFEEKKVDIWRCNEAAPPDIQPFSSERLLFRHSHILSHYSTLIKKNCSKYRSSSSLFLCAPNEVRTRVLALRGPRPGPLDDGGVAERKHSTMHHSPTSTNSLFRNVHAIMLISVAR